MQKPGRICHKCLTAHLDQAAYFQNMHDYIAGLDEDIKSISSIYNERLDICLSCDLLADAMCRGCGCFVEMRAAVKINTCPYDKW
jgi:hypothetical protein